MTAPAELIDAVGSYLGVEGTDAVLAMSDFMTFYEEWAKFSYENYMRENA